MEEDAKEIKLMLFETSSFFPLSSNTIYRGARFQKNTLVLNFTLFLSNLFPSLKMQVVDQNFLPPSTEGTYIFGEKEIKAGFQVEGV